MKNHEVEALVKLRNLVLEHYSGLEGEGSPNTAMTRTVDVASFCEELMGLVDAMLEPYVTFENENNM